MVNIIESNLLIRLDPLGGISESRNLNRPVQVLPNSFQILQIYSQNLCFDVVELTNSPNWPLLGCDQLLWIVDETFAFSYPFSKGGRGLGYPLPLEILFHFGLTKPMLGEVSTNLIYST